MAKYPNVKVKKVNLEGEDGNAFLILGRVTNAMRQANIPQEEINAYQKEAMSGNYDHLLQTTMAWVDWN